MRKALSMLLTIPIDSRHRFVLTKSNGPFIGPKGGKWKDAAHTIPYIGPEKGDDMKEASKVVDSIKELVSDPNPTDVRSVMIHVMAVARKSGMDVNKGLLRAVNILGSQKMPPASAKVVAQAVKLLTKATKEPKKPRGPKAKVLPLKKAGDTQ